MDVEVDLFKEIVDHSLLPAAGRDGSGGAPKADGPDARRPCYCGGGCRQREENPRITNPNMSIFVKTFHFKMQTYPLMFKLDLTNAKHLESIKY